MARAAWQTAKRAVLWLGLLLCIYALWRTRFLAGDAIGRIGPGMWAGISLLLLASWALSGSAWRGYLLAYTGRDPGWRSSIRQLGLLLVGKYVPGGVFGFLARVYDQPEAPRQRLFWAGLAEQVVGVCMPAVVGGVLYMAAISQDLMWACFIALTPIAAVAGLRSLHHGVGFLPWLRQHAVIPVGPRKWRTLLYATTLQLIQQIAWIAIVVAIGKQLFNLEGHAAAGVAGSFLLAVTAGMLVVIAPGGIGVREFALVGLASRWIDMTQAIFLTALLRLLSSVLDAFAGGVAACLARQRER